MRTEAIVIGGSAGGSKALKKILAKMPAGFCLPIIIVLHRKNDNEDYLIRFLDETTNLKVKEAEENEIITSGTVYIAPAGYHLLIEKDRSLSISVDELVSYARPSIDVLFESAAECFYENLTGIVLTGANCDGTEGVKTIKKYKGHTIAQDPEEAEFDLMPTFAIKSEMIDEILSIDEIIKYLLSIEEECRESFKT